MEPAGLLSEQFDYEFGFGFPGSQAPGTTNAGGGNDSVGVIANEFIATFIPGDDGLINYSPEAGVDYGDGEFSTGLSHEQTDGTGLYRIFFTFPDIDAGTFPFGDIIFTVTDDEDNLLLDSTKDQKKYANVWTHLGTVYLTGGETYTVTSVADGGFSSYFGGLMFEPIPEPSVYSAVLGGLMLIGVLIYRRRLITKKTD